MFIGSLLPYIEGIDSWLFEGTLDDPFEEVIVFEVLFVPKVWNHLAVYWIGI